MTSRRASQTVPFDKYKYYLDSVQSPDTDAEFLFQTYKERRNTTPTSMREDFCGTFALCCEWIKLRAENHAHGIDLDPEPLAYGREHHLAALNSEEQTRVHLAEGNVLTGELAKVDVVCALNFSYFIFKERKVLKTYLQNVYNSLNEGGMLVMDIFGGSECYEANEQETEHEGFSYFWDQDNYNPVNNNGQFYIHFQREGEVKREQVFSYDWRMWSIPEIKDILEEVGFKTTAVYWEGTDEDGEGDGNFTETQQGEECESWLAYIVADK